MSFSSEMVTIAIAVIVIISAIALIMTLFELGLFRSSSYETKRFIHS
jgi:hypothetical protein